jgi:CRISPR system Cascade subunit CasD
LADYHTTQVPSAKRGRRFSTRAQELSVPGHELNTILSRRDYRSGAWHLGALSLRHDRARWSLEELADAMRRPGFMPYLGRKSCPLGLPLAPRIADAPDAPGALLERHGNGPEVPLRGVLADPAVDTTVVLDAGLAGPNDPRHLRTEFRRDQPRSRRRWQFDLREEAVLRAGSP